MTDAPARSARDLPARHGSRYPAPFDEPCRERVKHTLGDVFGLTDFGVNLTILPPGAWSSQRHWHTSEDEFVYILEGTATLITDAGETEMGPGMCAGWPGGKADGHHLVNRTDASVVVLEVGSRKDGDDAYYSDIDMQVLGYKTGGWFSRKDGTPYPKD